MPTKYCNFCSFGDGSFKEENGIEFYAGLYTKEDDSGETYRIYYCPICRREFQKW